MADDPKKPSIGAIQEYYIAQFDAAPVEGMTAAAYGGKMAFRWVAALAIPLALVFFNLNKRFGNVPAVSIGSSSRAILPSRSLTRLTGPARILGY